VAHEVKMPAIKGALQRTAIKHCVRALPLLLLLFSATQAKPVVEVRVGITEYQNVEETYSRYYKLFQELSEAAGTEPVTFKFAIGTYEEVSDWYNKGQIDVAILSAMPVAELLLSIKTDFPLLAKLKNSYIGTLTPNPDYSSSSKKCGGDMPEPRRLFNDVYTDEPEKEERSKYPSSYRTVCLVPKDSDINDFQQILDLQRQNKLKILFVRPYSVSGYLIPSYYLEFNKKLNISSEAYDFSYQHENSLKRLMQKNLTRGMEQDPKDKQNKYLVAFVHDKTNYCGQNSSETYFKRIKTPELDAKEFEIPFEAVLISPRLGQNDFDNLKSLMMKLFKQRDETLKKRSVEPGAQTYISAFKEFKTPDQPGNDLNAWVRSYSLIMRAIQTIDKPRTLPYRFTINEIIKDLRLYKESQQQGLNGAVKPMRLALVLSGGGAKCAYQAGAIKEIESKLKGSGVDIDMVVGTSGGAINALFVALGITGDENAQKCLETTWSEFEQQDFFEPSWTFTLVFGLCLGFAQVFIFTMGAVLFGRGQFNWNRLGKWLVGLVLSESLLAIYLDYFHALSVSAALSILGQVIIMLVVATWFRLLLRRVTRDWWKQAGLTMLIVSTIELLIKLGQGPLTKLFEGIHSHLFQHLWMVVTLFSSWSAPIPFLLGLAMLATGHKRIPDFKLSRRRHRVMLVRVLAVAPVIMLVVLFLYAFLKMDSPSGQGSMESKFVEKVPGLIQCLGRTYNAQPAPNETELQALSGWIMQHKLLKRDLVITTSRLPMDERNEMLPRKIGLKDIQSMNTAGQSPSILNYLPANQLPEDLYFYHAREGVNESPQQEGLAQPQPVQRPPLGKQFVSFNEQENSNKLLDVVIGSGTIYPLFPYREIENLKVDTQMVEKVRIIDGGFIHNSPVDAALKWGATHIILIEASPQPRAFPPHNFWENSLLAFNYLFAQAQSIDKQSMGSVEMFALRPSTECDKLNREINCEDTAEPDMDTFDFVPALLKQAFTKGIQDAQDSRALFTRVLGPPLFREISNETKK